MQDSLPGRKKRSKWRLTVWLVFVGCVALIAYLLAYGLFYSADFTLKLEAWAVFFVIGCVLLALYRRSATKKKSSR
jgi:peptidoglycan/LPS O-acetylase OafA/YrhL